MSLGHIRLLDMACTIACVVSCVRARYASQYILSYGGDNRWFILTPVVDAFCPNK